MIFAVNQQLCDVIALLFSEWTRHQQSRVLTAVSQSANVQTDVEVPEESRALADESHMSLFVHLEELAVKFEGVNQCVTTCAVQCVTASVTMDRDPRHQVHTRVRAGIESIQITAHQRHLEDLMLIGPAGHVTVLGKRAEHVITREPLIQVDMHQLQSAVLDRLELRVKVMPLRAVCLIDTLTRVTVSTPCGTCSLTLMRCIELSDADTQIDIRFDTCQFAYCK